MTDEETALAEGEGLVQGHPWSEVQRQAQLLWSLTPATGLLLVLG